MKKLLEKDFNARLRQRLGKEGLWIRTEALTYPGFPDVVYTHPRWGMFLLELKISTNKLSPKQVLFWDKYYENGGRGGILTYSNTTGLVTMRTFEGEYTVELATITARDLYNGIGQDCDMYLIRKEISLNGN